jgi:hypothetical protein
MSGAGGFSLEASAATISGAPVTITLKNTNTHATFKGLYLEAHDASGAFTGSFTVSNGYKSLTCGGVPGASITTNSNAIRTVNAALTWTPPATPTSPADSAVTITGIVIASMTQWAFLPPVTLHRAVLAVSPGTRLAVSLDPPRPNPFRRSTTIEYSLPHFSPVRLTVQDVSGRQVRLLDDGFHAGGQYLVPWDGLDDTGRSVAPGIYFYRLEVPGSTTVRRAVMLGS